MLISVMLMESLETDNNVCIMRIVLQERVQERVQYVLDFIKLPVICY